MPVQETMRGPLPTDDLLAQDGVEICDNCGNIYRVEWLKVSDKFNDFGLRHCPFCGLLTYEW